MTTIAHYHELNRISSCCSAMLAWKPAKKSYC